MAMRLSFPPNRNYVVHSQNMVFCWFSAATVAAAVVSVVVVNVCAFHDKLQMQITWKINSFVSNPDRFPHELKISSIFACVLIHSGITC